MSCVNWMAMLCFSGLMVAAGVPAGAEGNLCPNPTFNSGKEPFERWGINYDWTGNENQMGNHKNVSFLPEFKGRSNVLKMTVPNSYESKVETPLIPYETGDRYTCTFDVYDNAGCIRVLFLGYNWRPGAAPTDIPLHQDMRRIYKGDAVSVGKSPSWKTVSISFPHEEISELAFKHLKKVRFLSVYLFVPGGTGYEGDFYIANVKIVKLPGKSKVKKGTLKSSGTEK